MNRKIIATICVLSFIILGCESSTSINIKKNNNELIDENIQFVATSVNEIDLNSTYIFQVFGPVRKITNINFIDGPVDIISKLNKLWSRRFFFMINPYVIVSNLTFIVTFNELVDKRSEQRYWYATTYTKFNLSIDDINEINTTINIPHSCFVYNFTGIIYFQKPKIFQYFSVGPKFFRPYRFLIVGYCEDIEVDKA